MSDSTAPEREVKLLRLPRFPKKLEPRGSSSGVSGMPGSSFENPFFPDGVPEGLEFVSSPFGLSSFGNPSTEITFKTNPLAEATPLPMELAHSEGKEEKGKQEGVVESLVPRERKFTPQPNFAFIIDGEKFLVDKDQVGCHSEKLKAVFEQDKSVTELPIKDVSAYVFEEFIKFAHTPDWMTQGYHPKQETLVQLAIFCDAYCAIKLLAVCEGMFIRASYLGRYHTKLFELASRTGMRQLQAHIIAQMCSAKFPIGKEEKQQLQFSKSDSLAELAIALKNELERVYDGVASVVSGMETSAPTHSSVVPYHTALKALISKRKVGGVGSQKRARS